MGKRPLQNESGATMVEFAIIALLLFSIIFAIIELGVLVFNQQVLTNASREGARAGVVQRLPRLPDRYVHPVTGQAEGVIDVVELYCLVHLVTFGDPAVPATVVTRSGIEEGDDLVVRVTYPFDFLVLSNLGVGPVTLTAETRMEME